MKKWIFIAVTGMLLASCEKERRCPGPVEKEFTPTAFNKVKIGGTFKVHITKAAAFSVVATGCASDLSDLEVINLASGMIEIRYRVDKSNRYQVDLEITMPEIVSLNLSGTVKGTVTGFEDQDIISRAIISGTAECTMDGAPVNVQIDISGNSILNISGNTESLYGQISGNSKLHAYNTSAIEVDISVSGNSKAYVKPEIRFFAEASGNSKIYYKGHPAVKSFSTSGNGEIIQE